MWPHDLCSRERMLDPRLWLQSREDVPAPAPRPPDLEGGPKTCLSLRRGLRYQLPRRKDLNYQTSLHRQASHWDPGTTLGRRWAWNVTLTHRPCACFWGRWSQTLPKSWAGNSRAQAASAPLTASIFGLSPLSPRVSHPGPTAHPPWQAPGSVGRAWQWAGLPPGGLLGLSLPV